MSLSILSVDKLQLYLASTPTIEADIGPVSMLTVSFTLALSMMTSFGFLPIVQLRKRLK
jgi:hypothetical protein